MNRRHYLQLTALAIASGTAAEVFAKGDDKMVGKLSVEELERVTDQGGVAVTAIKPAPGALSAADAALMQEVAAGGLAQLEASRLAADKATSADVKAFAKAEVKEQTVLSKKLKAVAKAKGGTIPSAPDEKGQAMLKKLQGLSGAEFDLAYMRESGVKGHQLLDKTMDRVRAKAEDPTLKALEAAAHPLILTHLQAAEGEVAGMA